MCEQGLQFAEDVPKVSTAIIIQKNHLTCRWQHLFTTVFSTLEEADLLHAVEYLRIQKSFLGKGACARQRHVCCAQQSLPGRWVNSLCIGAYSCFWHDRGYGFETIVRNDGSLFASAKDGGAMHAL
jgi:hypothetical protein